MKKLLLSLCLVAICSMNAFAQTPAIFYGVDFSQVKTYGADESQAEFATAFGRINDLFLAEPEKYDVGKFTHLPIARYELNVGKQATQAAFDQPYELYTVDPTYDCHGQIEGMIADYTLPQTEGLGIVMVANLLDKSIGRGFYYLVMFDIASRQITNCTRIEGKASGFGLRNFWANSLYLGLKAHSRQR